MKLIKKLYFLKLFKLISIIILILNNNTNSINILSYFKKLLCNNNNDNRNINAICHIKEYFQLLNNYNNLKYNMDCKTSISCYNSIIRINSLNHINIILHEVYKELSKDLKSNKTDKIDEIKYNKDINEINNEVDFLKCSYLVKLLKNNKNNVFFLYTKKYYNNINWISKSYNYKETFKNKILELKTLETYNKDFDKLIDKFILIFKVINAYLRLYSTEKVIEHKTIYRGVRLNKNDPILINHKKTTNNKNMIVFSPNSLSFTYDKSIAGEFAMLKNRCNKVSTIFIIENSNNCLGKNLNEESLSYDTIEEEYLLRSFTYLKVTKTTNIMNVKYIELICLKDNKIYENSFVMK